MIKKLQISFINSLVILVTLSVVNCNNNSDTIKSQDNGIANPETVPMVDSIADETHLYVKYKIDKVILGKILGVSNFHSIEFNHRNIGSDTNNYLWELVPEIKLTGGQQAPPPDTSGLLFPIGSSNLGPLKHPNNLKNYRIRKNPSGQYDLLQILISDPDVSSFELIPVHGNTRFRPPHHNPYKDHLCYDILINSTKYSNVDSATIYNTYGQKLNIDKQLFFELLQLNPRPPGSVSAEE